MLIFALSLCTANSYACYDDDDDDWYSYDNFYDDDDDDSGTNDDDDSFEIYLSSNSEYWRSEELDEVVVVGSASNNDDDDDWWRRYDNNDNGDEDDGYGYDDGDDTIDHSDRDNNPDKSDGYVIPEQLKKAFEKLPEKIQNILKENHIKISYNPTYRSPHGGYSSYDSEKKSIITSSLESYMLLREAIHAVQDITGALDTKSMSAEEFQEHALGDLYAYYKSHFDGGDGFSFTLEGFDHEGNYGWEKFIESCFDKDGNFDRKTFTNKIMEYFDAFQAGHENNPNYSNLLENNYNWNWDYFFDILDINVSNRKE